MIRKIKYISEKFFGYPEDSWARLKGPRGKKRSYGHYAGGSRRTRAELRSEAHNQDSHEQLRDYEDDL